jgi:hypothetical protein
VLVARNQREWAQFAAGGRRLPQLTPQQLLLQQQARQQARDQQRRQVQRQEVPTQAGRQLQQFLLQQLQVSDGVQEVAGAQSVLSLQHQMLTTQQVLLDQLEADRRWHTAQYALLQQQVVALQRRLDLPQQLQSHPLSPQPPPTADV